MTWLALGVAIATAGGASGEVRVESRPDGTRLVRNVGGGEARSATWQAPPPAALALPAVRRVPAVALGPSREELRRLVAEAAGREGLDPRLVEAVVRTESGWNPAARSHKGAMGLMQLMPATAVELAVADPWDASDNVRGGATYLRRMIDRFGHLEHALAAYNAGPAAVERYDGVPPYAETRAYVRRVLALYDGREAELSSAARRPLLVRGADGRLVLTNTVSSR